MDVSHSWVGGWSLKTWVSLIEYQTCGFLTALAIVLALVGTKLSARESTPELPPVVYFCRLRCSLLVAVPVIVRRLSID